MQGMEGKVEDGSWGWLGWGEMYVSQILLSISWQSRLFSWEVYPPGPTRTYFLMAPIKQFLFID